MTFLQLVSECLAALCDDLALRTLDDHKRIGLAETAHDLRAGWLLSGSSNHG